MVALYVTSSEGAAGKTTICAGLGKYLMSKGKKPGFLKPVITGGENLPGTGIDSDAVFMKHILALEEPVDYLSPVISDHNNLANSIREAYSRVSSGKDVVIIEGGHEQNQASYGIVEALDARVIMVEGYSEEMSMAKLINDSKGFGEHLLGVVVNKVPPRQMSTRFGDRKINILGVLPEDRLLSTLTVGELAEYIQGKILNSADKSSELVENFMLGAMSVDHGPLYFGRKANKAVVVRGERPDMQLAALETSTKCLVLSGGTAPIPAVLRGAEEKSIPIVLASDNTMATVIKIEGALGKVRFNQEKKLKRLAEIMEPHFNFQALYKGLGLAG